MTFSFFGDSVALKSLENLEEPQKAQKASNRLELAPKASNRLELASNCLELASTETVDMID